MALSLCPGSPGETPQPAPSASTEVLRLDGRGIGIASSLRLKRKRGEKGKPCPLVSMDFGWEAGAAEGGLLACPCQLSERTNRARHPAASPASPLGEPRTRPQCPLSQGRGGEEDVTGQRVPEDERRSRVRASFPPLKPRLEGRGVSPSHRTRRRRRNARFATYLGRSAFCFGLQFPHP